MKNTPENDSYQKILASLRGEEPEIPPNPFEQKYDNFAFIGNKKRPNPTPITKPIEENLVEHIEADIMFMNSIVSEEKRQKTKQGILERKPDIVILAETKVDDDDPEFQIDAYWLVTEINRKTGAVGMLVLAKDTIDIQSAVAVSVVKEVQVVSFNFNGHEIIGVYRSPTVLGPPINQHRKLIGYLSKLINKMPPETPYVITGDFNLPELAACDFSPVPKQFDYTDIFDNQKGTINQMWGDFFQKYNLYQHVTEPSRATSYNILDLLITPKTQDIPYLKIDQMLFHNTFDHFPVIFKIETTFITDETMSKEVQIVYRLFLVNCYLLHVPRLPSQLASTARG